MDEKKKKRKQLLFRIQLIFPNLFIKLKLFIHLLIYGCFGSSLLHAGFSLVVGSKGFFLIAVGSLLVAVASLVEHGI